MAAALPFIAVALSAGSAVMQVDAAGKAKKAANANARLIQQENNEEARRLGLEQKRVEARQRAVAGASGGGGNSQTNFMSSTAAEHSKELAWLKKSGSSRSGIARQEGKAAYKQGLASAVGSLSSAAGSLGEAI